jgi:ribosomal protein L34
MMNIKEEKKGMLQKNIEKQERKNRATWVGYYSRITPTKRGKQIKADRRAKSKGYQED